MMEVLTMISVFTAAGEITGLRLINCDSNRSEKWKFAKRNAAQLRKQRQRNEIKQGCLAFQSNKDHDL